MGDKRSLIRTIMVSMLSMISLPIAILGGLFVFGDYFFFHQDRLELKKNYLEEQQNLFRQEVNRAVSHLEWRLSSQNTSPVRLKKEIMDWFKEIRFQSKGRESGRLFVISYDGKYLLPEDSAAESGGEAFGTDSKGIAEHEAFIHAAQNPIGGFVDYVKKDSKSHKIIRKRAYIRDVPAFGWYVGAGFHLNDVDPIIAKRKSELKTRIQKDLTTVALLLTAMFLLQYLIYRVMIRKIIAGFNSFVDFFQSAEKKHATVRKRSLYFTEFIDLAKSADKMIHERQQAENALRESENRYRSIIESIEEGYCELDVQGRIIFSNAVMQDILGYSENELLNINTNRLLPEEDAERVSQYFANIYVSEKAPSEYIFPVIRKDGTKKYIEVMPSIIKDGGGNKKGLRSIVRDVDQRKKYEENLIYLAYHDALTGLKNRKAFYEQLQDAMYHARRYGTEIGLIYIDIDKFKKVNDTLGHEMGDVLLRKIKDRLQRCLRKTDFISRIGGDEFVIIVDNPTKIHPAVVAQRIVEELSQPYALNGHFVDYVTSSVGLSTFPTDAEDMDSLIKKADQAMYKAKEKRNRYYTYSDLERS